jgi:hypothetical protein
MWIWIDTGGILEHVEVFLYIEGPNHEQDKIVYDNLMQRAQALDDSLAVTASKLKAAGAQIVAFGNALQNPENLREGEWLFEGNFSEAGYLGMRYYETRLWRKEIEAKLGKFSCHQGNASLLSSSTKSVTPTIKDLRENDSK